MLCFKGLIITLILLICLMFLEEGKKHMHTMGLFIELGYLDSEWKALWQVLLTEVEIFLHVLTPLSEFDLGSATALQFTIQLGFTRKPQMFTGLT